MIRTDLYDLNLHPEAIIKELVEQIMFLAEQKGIQQFERFEVKFMIKEINPYR